MPAPQGVDGKYGYLPLDSVRFFMNEPVLIYTTDGSVIYLPKMLKFIDAKD